jgi:glycosyltransferase involved in cell wall biosynthesis
LEAAIVSILKQTWRGTLEILVVDDGSTDDTVEVATRLSERYGAVRVVRHDRNYGRPTARNTVLREARGKFLTWMDADDEWYPNKLAVQFDVLLSHLGEDWSQPIICMCAFDWRWSHSGKLSHRTPELVGDQLKGLLRGRIGAYLWTMLGTLSTFRAVGDFDENLPRLQDLDFTIRFVARGGRLIMSDPRMPLCLYHKSDQDKPGRVIAQSMAHIRRKHGPLFWQYGGRFRRGARRQHYLLAARHGFKNEGRWVGIWYSVLARLATPGLALRPLTRLLGAPGTPKVAKPRELKTNREDCGDLAPIVRNAGGPAAVDVVVSCTGHVDAPLRTYLRSLSHASRHAGIWYLPAVTSGLESGARDHRGVLTLLETRDAKAAAVIRRMSLLAATSNNDGCSSLVYLGTPVDLDNDDVGVLDERIARLHGQLELFGEVAREHVDQLRLHVVLPDSETLLWRRYGVALARGEERPFDTWLQAQSPALAGALDHRFLRPLLALKGFALTHVHLVVETSTLNDLRLSMARAIGSEGGLPRTDGAPIGLPTRHPGLPHGERLLQKYVPVLGRGDIEELRRKFWSLPASESPGPAAKHSLEWLQLHGRWASYAERFRPARTSTAGRSPEERFAPQHFRYPVASEEAFRKSIEDLRILQALARDV